MKFKALFLLFNIVFLVIFLTVFFMPMSLLGADAFRSFWAGHWGLGALFIAIVIAVNAVFAKWWRLLDLLEAQDWAGLSNYLEKKVYNRERVTASTIRLFIESTFLIGDFEGILKLSDRLGAVDPANQARFAHVLAAALVVGGKYADAREVCLAVSDNPRADGDWTRFFAAFTGSLLGSDFPVRELAGIADSARDPVVTALSGYLLSKPGRDVSASEQARARIIEKYGRKKWDALLRDAGTGVHLIVLSSLTGEATEWLYGPGEAGKAVKAAVRA